MDQIHEKENQVSSKSSSDSKLCEIESITIIEQDKDKSLSEPCEKVSRQDEDKSMPEPCEKESRQDEDKSMPELCEIECITVIEQVKDKSLSDSEISIIEITIADSDPDQSYGDFFCKMCDSHMNSLSMWEAHVTGRRHIKNVKKGDTDSKYEDLDVESYIKNEIKNVKDPVLGLSYIQEIRRREPGFPAMYNCFLCHTSIATVPLVIEHVTGVKHQLNFMRENDPDEHKLIEAMNLKKGLIEPAVLEVAAKLEEKYGKGTVQVKLEKPTAIYKRKWEENEDDKGGYRKSFKNDYRSDEARSRDSYKSSDTPRRSRKIYRRETDRDMRRFNSRSPQSPLLRPSYIFRKLASRNRISPERYRRRNSYSSERDDVSRRSSIPTHSTPDYRKSDSYSSSRHPQSRIFQTLDNILSRSCAEPEMERRTTFYVEPDIERRTTFYVEPEKIEPPKASTNVFKDFLSQIVSLPPELFFKIVLMKLDTIELRGINELEMLSKIIAKASNVRRKSLPPDVQAILKLRTNTNEHDVKLSATVPKLPPQDSSSRVQNMNSDMGFNCHNPQAQQAFDVRATVNELVFGRNEAEASSMNQQTHSSKFNNTNIPTSTSQIYQNSGAQSHIPVFTLTDTSSIPQMRNFWPPVNMPSLSQHRPSFPPPFTNVLPSDSNYQNRHSSSFPKHTSIPGLTLAEKECPQSQPSEYSSQFKWSSPRKTYSFERY